MISNESTRGWTPPSGGRGTSNIVWSCSITIFLCCWTSLCVNVPSLGSTRLDRFRDKLHIAFVAILAPDLLIVLSMGQWEAAKESVKVDIFTMLMTGKLT